MRIPYFSVKTTFPTSFPFLNMHLRSIVSCVTCRREKVNFVEYRDGYTPQVYSFDFRCVLCDLADVYINLVKYGLAAFSDPTIFLLYFCFA